jgi:hypothetical protein
LQARSKQVRELILPAAIAHLRDKVIFDRFRILMGATFKSAEGAGMVQLESFNVLVSESESHRLYYASTNLLMRSCVEAMSIQVVALVIEVSKSFARRRFRLSQARVRSTATRTEIPWGQTQQARDLMALAVSGSFTARRSMPNNLNWLRVLAVAVSARFRRFLASGNGYRASGGGGPKRGAPVGKIYNIYGINQPCRSQAGLTGTLSRIRRGKIGAG